MRLLLAAALYGRTTLFSIPSAPSTLPVTGGRTSNRIKAMKFGKYVRFASASTLTQGLFDSKKRARCHDARQSA